MWTSPRKIPVLDSWTDACEVIHLEGSNLATITKVSITHVLSGEGLGPRVHNACL